MSEFTSFEDLEKEIEKVKGEFYNESGGKNLFFKKQQKYDCAKQILTKIPIEVLLTKSCYIIENSNCVHIDYPVLKSYMSPDTFKTISDYIIANFQNVKNNHKTLEVMLNFDGITVSAAERYIGLIETFCLECFKRNTGFSQLVSKFVVYNSPSALDAIKNIVMPFMEENVKSKLLVVPKKESNEYVFRFLQNNT